MMTALFLLLRPEEPLDLSSLSFGVDVTFATAVVAATVVFDVLTCDVTLPLIVDTRVTTLAFVVAFTVDVDSKTEADAVLEEECFVVEVWEADVEEADETEVEVGRVKVSEVVVASMMDEELVGVIDVIDVSDVGDDEGVEDGVELGVDDEVSDVEEELDDEVESEVTDVLEAAVEEAAAPEPAAILDSCR
jgi:hypothetical protein